MKKLFIKFIALFLMQGSALADSAVWDFYLENDIFAAGNLDRHFSNGWELARAQNDLKFSIGQQIYTPENKRTNELIENDRPYAGFLFISGTQERIYENKRDEFKITLGVIGPLSFAEQTQKFVHNDLGFGSDIKGWDNQLRNEPIINLHWTRSLRGSKSYKWGLEYDHKSEIGVDFGNAHTQIRVGNLVRIGYQLLDDFDPQSITVRSFQARNAKAGQDRDSFSVYAFGGSLIRAVLYNIFTDGNLFKNSHSVDTQHVVGELRFGIVCRYQNTRLSYTYIIITEEFEEQSGLHQYGSLNFGWGW